MTVDLWYQVYSEAFLEKLQDGDETWRTCNQRKLTLPKFNMEPEDHGFQKDLPFPGTYFQVPC